MRTTNTTYNAKDFLTADKFAKKYGFSSVKEKQFVSAAIRILYKRGALAKTSAGNMTPVIHKSRTTHNEASRYKVHPLFEDYVLKEIENQKRLYAKRTQGGEK